MSSTNINIDQMKKDTLRLAVQAIEKAIVMDNEDLKEMTSRFDELRDNHTALKEQQQATLLLLGRKEKQVEGLQAALVSFQEKYVGDTASIRSKEFALRAVRAGIEATKEHTWADEDVVGVQEHWSTEALIIEDVAMEALGFASELNKG